MRITRRELVTAAAGAAAAGLVTAAPARAKSSGRPFRILMLTYRGETDVERGFRDYLSASGRDFEFVARDANRDPGKVADFLQEVPDLKPDLIYTWGTPITLQTVGPYDAPDRARFVNDIPVVFALVAAPVKAKIAPAFASSGRNVTGAVHVVPTDVQMRALQSYRPAKTVGVLYSTTEQNSVAIVAELRALLGAKDVKLVEQTFTLDAKGQPSAEGVADKVRQLKADGAEWLYLLPDTFLGTIYSQVTPVARDAKLPTFGAAELAVREGGALVGLVSRYYSVGQLAAQKALDILVDGKKPSEVPIETLKRFSLIINMKVAKQLDAYPPIAMLDYAEVIT
ncbi:ABC transporter substrate-binding protein [Ancylobacter terrae]|uniref:ABC transporter substrate-binding protein n=1 Tax=Ancylobacter sp. sgz301288 TaxID=3342077 RepID=UPI00385C225C